jgi:acyl carrier protein
MRRAQLTELEIYKALMDVFREVFEDDHLVLRPKIALRDIPGYDSAKRITIILSVEERFGFQMNSREIDQIYLICDLAGLIKAKVKAP